MKNILLFALIFTVFFLISCSGSDVYQGAWKATDAQGSKFEITFEPKSFTVKDAAGTAHQFSYTQNSVKIENSVKTYGITLSDGRVYSIFFPIAGNQSKGIITFQNNAPAYTISRTDYIQYSDLFKLTN